jgi:hypothetical protein
MVTTRAPAAFAVATAAASALASATTTVACREARLDSGAAPPSGACRCSTSVSTDTSPWAWYQSAPSRSSSRATAALVPLVVSSTGTWALAAAFAAPRIPSVSPARATTAPGALANSALLTRTDRAAGSEASATVTVSAEAFASVGRLVSGPLDVHPAAPSSSPETAIATRKRGVERERIEPPYEPDGEVPGNPTGVVS